MKRSLIAVSAAAAILAAAIVVRAQDGMGGPPQDEPPAMPEVKPGKHHEHIKKSVGEWETAAKFWMQPGADPTESKGSETVREICGGLWFTSDYKGDMMGAPFTGHSLTGYDMTKDKYVAVWVDSMTSSLMVLEGPCEKDGKLVTLAGDMVDPSTGGKVGFKEVLEWKDDNTRVVTLYMTNDQGEAKFGEITYTRKKK